MDDVFNLNQGRIELKFWVKVGRQNNITRSQLGQEFSQLRDRRANHCKILFQEMANRNQRSVRGYLLLLRAVSKPPEK